MGFSEKQKDNIFVKYKYSRTPLHEREHWNERERVKEVWVLHFDSVLFFYNNIQKIRVSYNCHISTKEGFSYTVLECQLFQLKVFAPFRRDQTTLIWKWIVPLGSNYWTNNAMDWNNLSSRIDQFCYNVLHYIH